MIPAFVLALREGIEAVLVLTLVLGILTKSGRSELKRYAWWGAAIALLLSFAAAAVITWAGAEFEGNGEIIFEGSAMLLAGSFLIWMVFWVRRQASSTKHDLEAKIGLSSNGKAAKSIFGVTFFAVLREGIELALFLVAISIGVQKGLLLAGALGGIASAALVGFLVYSSTRKVRMAPFFRVTNILLMFFAAGLLAGSAREFSELGLIPLIVPKIYDLTPVLNTTSFLGGIMKALFGYNPAPSLIEILVYLSVLLVITLSMLKPFRPVQAKLKPTS